MRNRWLAWLLLPLLGACSGVEGNLRDLNKSLYRSIGGDRPPIVQRAGGGSVLANCFNADTGMLYPSQTGRCAPGYSAIPLSEAEQQLLRREEAPAGREVARQSLPPTTAAAVPQPSESLRADGQALCYDDRSQTIFGADQCPPGSRWIDTPEAEALQLAALQQAQWCYFSGRRLLYRARACRPGDAVLDVAAADQLWNELPGNLKPRERPGARQRNLDPVPKVQAAPRGRIDASPLPAPR